MGDFSGTVSTNGIDIYPDNCGKYGVGPMNGEGDKATELLCNE